MVRVPVEVASFLKQKLDGRKLRELAAETGIHEKSLHRHLNARNMPSLALMGALCRAYNCDIHDIAPSFPHRSHNGNHKPKRR